MEIERKFYPPRQQPKGVAVRGVGRVVNQAVQVGGAGAIVAADWATKAALDGHAASVHGRWAGQAGAFTPPRHPHCASLDCRSARPSGWSLSTRSSCSTPPAPPASPRACCTPPVRPAGQAAATTAAGVAVLSGGRGVHLLWLWRLASWRSPASSPLYSGPQGPRACMQLGHAGLGSLSLTPHAHPVLDCSLPCHTPHSTDPRPQCARPLCAPPSPLLQPASWSTPPPPPSTCLPCSPATCSGAPPTAAGSPATPTSPTVSAHAPPRRAGGRAAGLAAQGSELEGPALPPRPHCWQAASPPPPAPAQLASPAPLLDWPALAPSRPCACPWPPSPPARPPGEPRDQRGV